MNHGGGIFNEGGTVILDNSTISSNTANEGGGVFNWDDGSLSVQNSSAIGETGFGNSATSDGGGIYNFIATVTVDGSTVSANTAVNGGGIFNGGSEFFPSTLVITNSSVIGGTGAGNTAANGGGINNNQLGVTTLFSSTVSANDAADGGGIFNLSGLTIQDSSTIGGVTGANTATNGDGVYNADGTAWLDNSTILSNTASTHGGGVYNDASLYVKNESAVSSNEATINGGGIYHSGTLSITNSTIGGIGTGNIAGQYGGGIYNKLGTTTIDSSTISANTADYGGGICNGATLIIFNNSLIGGFGAGNIAASEGGGIYNLSGSATISGCRIIFNTATNGGGIFNNENTTAATHMTGSCFSGNSDTSFFNNMSALQIATGNWWGTSAGPNSPGADTVAGNVDVSGYLTVPILGCKIYIFLPLIMR